MRARNQQICEHDQRFVSSIEPEQQSLLIVARRFQDRMSELPHKQGGQTQEHCLGEIEEDEHIAENEHTRTQQMEELINHIAVRCQMVVMLSMHYFGIEVLNWLGNSHQAPCHFLD